MSNQTYGQYCGLARALEVVGEPWAMLVIRDLFIEPKTFAQLRQGLPQTSAAVLSARLEELERADVVRRVSSGSGDSGAYELTDYGRELEDIVVRLTRWGLRTMGGFRRDEIITDDILITALRVTFRSEVARGVSLNFVLEVGDIVIHARVNDGSVEVGKGHLLDPDLIIEAGPPLKLLLAGDVSPREALETGGVRLRAPDGGAGNTGLLAWFVELFRIPPPPIARVSVDGLAGSMKPVPAAPPAVPEHAVPEHAARAGAGVGATS